MHGINWEKAQMLTGMVASYCDAGVLGVVRARSFPGLSLLSTCASRRAHCRTYAERCFCFFLFCFKVKNSSGFLSVGENVYQSRSFVKGKWHRWTFEKWGTYTSCLLTWLTSIVGFCFGFVLTFIISISHRPT